MMALDKKKEYTIEDLVRDVDNAIWLVTAGVYYVVNEQDETKLRNYLEFGMQDIVSYYGFFQPKYLSEENKEGLDKFYSLLEENKYLVGDNKVGRFLEHYNLREK